MKEFICRCGNHFYLPNGIDGLISTLPKAICPTCGRIAKISKIQLK